MTVILEIKANVLAKSFSLNSLKGLRRAMRIFADASILATAVLLSPHTSTAQHTPPTADEVEALAEGARSERYVGKEVRLPDAIFNELVAGVTDGYPYCNPKDRNILGAYQINLRSNLPGGIAVKGQGGCFCSPTGNCAFWIYQLKDGKYRALLERGSVQMFGFLRSRTHGYPDLVTWTHGSATEYGARLFRFDGHRYLASGGWDEEYEYLGDDGQIVKPDKPRITSHFSSKDELPNEVKP